MNNIPLWGNLYPQKLQTNRIYRIMKITLALTFVSIFSMFANNVQSQNARITIAKSNATLESILNEIVTLGYTFPKKWMKKAGVNNLRVFASGFNLLTFTAFKYLDPESSNVIQGYYPQQRTFTFGLDVTF